MAVTPSYIVVVARQVREGEDVTVDTSAAFKNSNPKYPQIYYDKYGLANPYFNDEKTLDECLESLKIETRHYAKRQLTWFRKNENINWVYPDDYENTEDMYKYVFSIINEFLKE